MADTELTEIRPINKMVNGVELRETQVLISPDRSLDAATASPPVSWNSRFSCGTQRLAIISIVCGLSCVGIRALLLAVQAKQEKERDPQRHRALSRRSRRMSLLSISLWVGILVSLPLLLVLLSYVLAQVE